MNPSTIIELKNVTFSYNGAIALENVSLIINEKDFLGIIGPNGGGKTTLLKLILGLLEPGSGVITVFGKKPKLGRRHIGYVPQHISFDFKFPISVMEVVLMSRLGKNRIGRRYSKADKQIAENMLNRVGMIEYKNRLIGDLSGGQRQRVFIARALAIEPKMLILDEPASSLDAQWQTAFYDLLHELNNRLTIMLVTHDVSVVSMYIDQIACVNRTIHYHGSTKDGIHRISKMYHCPVELVAHSVPHRSLGGHKNV